MPDRFEALTDNDGRLERYVRNGDTDAWISPENVGTYLSGGERVMLVDTEYNLDEVGRLIHPGVEVPSSVDLSSGVRLDEGTIFRPKQEGVKDPEGTVLIGPRTRIGGTEIRGFLSVGKHAVILAKSINGDVEIGDHTRLAEGVMVLAGTVIGNRVRVRKDAWIANEVTIEDGVQLARGTRVCTEATIMKGAIIKARKAPKGQTRANQGGPPIRPGKVIEAYAEIIS